MVEETHPNCVIDLDQIWKSRTAPDAILEQPEKTAKASHKVLVSPPPERANVTEWAKQKQCWDRLAAMPVAAVPKLVRVLKENGEEREERRRARGEAREGVTISAAMEVVKRGQDGFWDRALEHRNVRRLLTIVELGILETAARREATWVPSDAQAKRLMEAAKKLENDGLL